MNILLTGFNEFSGSSTNPSWDMLQGLPETVGGYNLVLVQLPTEYYRATEVLLAAVDEHSPVAILAFGLSGNYSNFRIESLGINLGSSFALPDNAGVSITGLYRPGDGELVAHRLPNTQDPVTWLADAPVEGQVSTDAGTYVCNSICYDWGREVRRRPDLGSIPCWFTHVPASTESGISGYKKPLADLTASVLAMVQGVVNDYLYADDPTDPDPDDPAPSYPAPPVIAANPRKTWWGVNRSTTEFALFEYQGGLTLGATRKGDHWSYQYRVVENVTGVVSGSGGTQIPVDIVVGPHATYPGKQVIHYTFARPATYVDATVVITFSGTAANGATFNYTYTVVWAPGTTGKFALAD